MGGLGGQCGQGQGRGKAAGEFFLSEFWLGVTFLHDEKDHQFGENRNLDEYE